MTEAAIPSFTISVNALPGAGKTSLLRVILDALSEKGLLDRDTNTAMAVDSLRGVEAVRRMNEPETEAIRLKLKTSDIVDAALGLVEA